MQHAILILAAGQANRMGKIKQLLPFRDGNILSNVITNALNANLGTVYCILGANYLQIEKGIGQFSNLEIIINPNWANGIGSSISAGVEYILKKQPQVNSIMIILGDQPLIESADIITLHREFYVDTEKIIATNYGHSSGVPAVFPKAYFQQLLGLFTDKGAKTILQTAENMRIINFSETKIFDIDTYNDYMKLQGFE